MIIKIIINNIEKSLKDLIEFFQKRNLEMIFMCNALYVFYEKKQVTTKQLQKQLSRYIEDEVFCQEIDEHNLSYEKASVIGWCKDKFIQRDTIKFEQERQEELLAMSRFISDIDRELSILCNTKAPEGESVQKERGGEH